MASLSAITIENGTSSNIISSKKNSLDFKSLEKIAEVPSDQRKLFTDSDAESLTKVIDLTDSDLLSKKISISGDVRYSEDFDEANVQKALSRMTINDLDQFLNVYKIITSSDPNADDTINQASMDQLLSGELLDGEYNVVDLLHIDEIETNVNDEKATDDPVNDYTFFDVYDHIESWKKRLQPAMNIIDDLAHKYKTIVRQTVTTADDLKEPISNVSVEETIKNDNVMTDSLDYLSNIDKYIETHENREFILNNKLHHMQNSDDYNIENDTFLHSIKYSDMQILNENISAEVLTAQTEVSNRRTLLIPSDTYLEIENKINNDELEVKTYFLDES